MSAPRPQPDPHAAPVPRASDLAHHQQQRQRVTESPARPSRRLHARNGRVILLFAAGILLLLLAGVGAAPLAAAERPTGPSSGSPVLAAQDDPPSSPSPTPWPTPPGVKGLDVSHWNGQPDFEKLRDEGMRFVFSKATQGTSFVDDTYQRHTRDARDAGVLPGAYHFFDYTKGGIAQARHFLDTVRAATGLGALLPLVVDVETLGSLGTPNRTKAKARLHAMLDEIYRQTGRYPMIYTSRHMWEKVVNSPTSFGKYPLWVACWSCDDIYLPNGWNDWLFWQVGPYKFPGGPKLDGNLFSANMDKLRLERQRGLRLDDGAAWASDRAVQADLRGYDGKEVRVGLGEAAFGAWRPFDTRVEFKLSSKQGQQDVRLQLRSFRNVKTVSLGESIKLDSVPPKVEGPTIRLRRGKRVQASGSRIPATATISASDKTSGLDSSSLKATCGGVQRASRVGVANGAALGFQLDRSGCTIKGTAKDQVGHSTTRQLDPEVALIDVRKDSTQVSLSKGWRTLKNKDALGDSLSRSAAVGAQMVVSFEGSQVAIVARRGPAGGRFKVIMDGKHVDTIDLYAKSGDSRRIVSVRSIRKGKHVLKLKATGTRTAKSSGAIVWLDAVLVLDRRS